MGWICRRAWLRSKPFRRGAPAFFAGVAADAVALPFRDGFFDVVFVMHVLHHVPDRLSALKESRRVLKPNGSVVVSTAGPRHLLHLRRLLEDAVTDVGGGEMPIAMLTDQFDIDVARQELSSVFASVDSYIETNRLNIPVSDAIVAYIDSLRRPDIDQRLPPLASWRDVLASARARADAEIVKDRVFRTRTETAAFRCRMSPDD